MGRILELLEEIHKELDQLPPVGRAHEATWEQIQDAEKLALKLEEALQQLADTGYLVIFREPRSTAQLYAKIRTRINHILDRIELKTREGLDEESTATIQASLREILESE